jgi:hypothetical protein
MSIEVMSRVWDLSRAKGGNLLILLAIANYADIHGCAYPSVATLASRGRMTERNVQYCLRELEAIGELKIERDAGPHGTHIYQIIMGENISGEKISGVKSFRPKKNTHKYQNLHDLPDEKFSGVKSFRGEAHFTGGVKPTSPEPSLEPSVKETTKEEETLSSNSAKPAESNGAVRPEMSIDELIDSWNDICGTEGLPKINSKGRINHTLRQQITRRLKEHPELAFWEVTLNKVYRSMFLSGQRSDWKATLTWLVKNDSNAVKVYQGDYDGHR